MVLPESKLHFTTGRGLLLLRPDDPPPGFTMAFTTRIELRRQGPHFCNYGFFGKPGARRNRENLMLDLNLPADKLTAGKQEHTANVSMVDQAAAGRGGLWAGTRIPATDALATNLPGVCLAVMTADCVPILLADPAAPAAAAIHAGWRGSAAGIVANTVQAMKSAFGSRPRNITAWLGPHIGPCCYEVGADVARHVKEPAALNQTGRKYYLNLAAWNISLLRDAGVLKKNIHVTDYCTSCRTDLFYSYRADTKNRGSIASLIAIAE